MFGNLFGRKRVKNLELGDVIYASKFHYPQFPQVVVAINPLMTMEFSYSVERDNLSFYKMEKPEEFHAGFDPLPDPVVDWIDKQVDRFLEEGVVPGQVGVKVSHLTNPPEEVVKDDAVVEEVAPVAKPEPIQEKVAVQARFAGESWTTFVENTTKDEHGWYVYHRLLNAMKKKEIANLVYGDGTRVHVDGSRLVSVRMRVGK